MLIALQGKYSCFNFEIDDEDWNKISSFNFYGKESTTGNIYVLCYNKGDLFYLARFLLSAKKGTLVDHKDRNTLNNKKDNLICTSFLVNNNNINRSGKGINKVIRKSGKISYQVRLSRYGNRLQIGCFDTEELAIENYIWAVKFFLGEDISG